MVEAQVKTKNPAVPAVAQGKRASFVVVDELIEQSPVPKGKWRCHRCKTINKDSHRYCDSCFNEPTAGRRDIDPEGRKFNPDPGHD
jgi:rRNA maturation endonuclease Nob1